MGIFEKVFGTYSDRELKRIMPIVQKVESYDEQMQSLSSIELRDKTQEFKDRLVNGETLDDILPEAFAVMREASWRVLGMKHFRVQIIGGIVLHQGRIAEMKTGEGKTLVATLPAYLNALSGKGVHVITVNDYLAKRDSEWMGKVYSFLGLSVGLIVNGLKAEEKKVSYAADITYGTNNEFGFDYLRDNMAITRDEQVQRRNYAIVDEVDSILVDEARTPLIISGASSQSTQLYDITNKFVRNLTKKVIIESDDKQHDDSIAEDYVVDEKARTVTLTEHGVKKAEESFGITNLSDPENMTISHHINQAIRAHGIMRRDKDYVVKDGEVLIIDEFTGRIMIGRRYNNGLHQAIEAKENVKVARESKTLATITFQNFFRLYNKLSGMTGTARTEEVEFQTIYKLDVIEIPTNMPLARVDQEDSIFKDTQGKTNAILDKIVECNQKGQPVLVGTITIEKSEELSRALSKRGIKHEVLNAKFHEKEAEIVAQAGKYGSVTIATNMAGRGTDIVLGGNAEFMAKREMVKKGYTDELIAHSTSFAETDDLEILESRKTFKELHDKFKIHTDEEHERVVEAGGLYIIGTERHESRRIDNQLRGRSGRQGDPGESKFYISLDDDLVRLFGSEAKIERAKSALTFVGMESDMPIEAKFLSGVIETAQKRVEGKNFEIRKNVLKYDDVMNTQRELVYSQRQKVLEGEDLKTVAMGYAEYAVDSIIESVAASSSEPEEWDWVMFEELVGRNLNIKIRIKDDDIVKLTKESLKENLNGAVKNIYERKENEFGDKMRELERIVLLQVVDQQWMDHIDAMDQLQQGIRLRGYAHDPVIEYKFEGMTMFEEMVNVIKEETVRFILHASAEKQHSRTRVAAPTNASHGGEAPKPVKRAEAKVGRNDLCPCGSGKKYKKCCGE